MEQKNREFRGIEGLDSRLIQRIEGDNVVITFEQDVKLHWKELPIKEGDGND